jgi:hypothetical protein
VEWTLVEAETTMVVEYEASTGETKRHGPAMTAREESIAKAPASKLRETIVKRVTKVGRKWGWGKREGRIDCAVELPFITITAQFE